MPFAADDARYDSMTYRRTGRSGLDLPALSLGPVAQLRGHHPAGHPAGGPAAGVRPGHHAHRPGQQLRPAVRVRRGELRPDPGLRPAPVPRRAGHLLQGRLRHVARAVRRRRLAQVPAVLAGPVPGAHRRGLRRHLLLPPPRPVGADRGDDGRPAHRGDQREGPVRGHLELLARRRPGPRSRCWPTWAPRCSSTSPATRCSTGTWRTWPRARPRACSTSSATWASAPSCSPRWRRVCSPAATCRATSPRTPARPSATSSSRPRCPRPTCPARGR